MKIIVGGYHQTAIPRYFHDVLDALSKYVGPEEGEGGFFLDQHVSYCVTVSRCAATNINNR